MTLAGLKVVLLLLFIGAVVFLWLKVLLILLTDGVLLLLGGPVRVLFLFSSRPSFSKLSLKLTTRRPRDSTAPCPGVASIAAYDCHQLSWRLVSTTPPSFLATHALAGLINQ